MNNKDLIIREKLQKDKKISDKADKIFNNFKEEFKLENNEGKKVIKISFNKFLAIAASVAIVGALGTILCVKKPWENKSKLDIQAEQKDEPKVPEIILDKEWEKDNIKLKYPSDWDLIENEVYAEPTVLKAPGDNNDEKAKLYITINENTGNRSAKEIIKEATNPDYGVPTKTISEGEKDIESVKAYYKTQSMSYDDGSNWNSTTIILIKDIFMYEFRFTGIEDEYNSYYPVFDKILDSVEFINLTSAYDNYKDLKWMFKDEKKTEFEFDGDKITIENGRVYLKKRQQDKMQVDVIEGRAKYLTGYGTQTLEKIYIITEEGYIWKSDYDREGKGIDAAFKKINLNGKVIDMTNGDYTKREIEPPYFLLSTGKLVNEEGSQYEELERDFVKSFGWNGCLFYVGSDNTISYYNYKTREYIKIKDLNGQDLKMRDAFIQWSSIYNNIVEENGGVERVFIVKQNGELVYFDGYEKFEVKIYEKAKGKIIKEINEEKEEVEYGGQIRHIRVKFTDGTELLIKDANENYFEI